MRVSMFVVLAALGCAAQRSEEPSAVKEDRPIFPAGPSAGELFEGPVRLHTQGIRGDALGCTVAPLGDTLAFSWNNHQTHAKIYTLPVAGGPPSQVTFGAWDDIDPEFMPAASPEAYRLAFASNREGQFDIYMVSLTGAGGAWQLTSDKTDEMHPSFAPDGRRLAFARLDRDGAWRLWCLDLATLQETHLGPGMKPAWSPAGDRIAFQLAAGTGARQYSLWIMRADGTQRTQIAAFEDFGAAHPAWSPDGRFLAFTRLPLAGGARPAPWGGDIYAVELDSGALFRLTAADAIDTDPCWGLDGWIYFSSTRTTGRFNLVSARPDPALLAPRLSGDAPHLPKGGTR